jgi:hypothetical protein
MLREVEINLCLIAAQSVKLDFGGIPFYIGN